MEPNQKTILIAGPTASGKSGLAVALAEKFGGTVINGDSMQVYRELRILTARPSAEDEARVQHLLYGHVPAAEAYSAGRYVADAARAIDEARASGRMPIIVGGTGLYFKALLEGLSPIPAIPEEIRQHWRELENEQGASALWAVLMDKDPEMARRLKPNDGQRIVRALEVQTATGQSLAHWQRMPGVPVIAPEKAVKFVLMPDRDSLRARADARFDQMIAAGALAEVEALAQLNLDTTLPAMRAIGVAPLMQLVAGQVSEAEAIAQAKVETRQYIKRQATWLARNMITWKYISAQVIESTVTSAIAFIEH